MIIRARVAFRNDQPDRELIGVREVKFMENGDSQWVVHHPKDIGLKTWTFKVGEIAYIQMGTY